MDSAPRPPSPPTFRSRVKRYTEDTQNVAAWLRQTALNCGYAASTASSSVESCNGKKAEYLIKTSEFIPMAEAIAAHKPQPTIPQDVLATISRAIRLRRRETRYVKLFGAKCRQSQLGDSTHTHFTEKVLGKVRDVLRPIVQPTAPEPQATTASSLSEKLASFFGSETDEADNISDEPFNNLTPVHIDFDDMEVEDEFFLAIDAFMEDVFVMRQYVEYIWTMYKESVMENNVCSLLTNTAIDVVRLAENEFAKLIKRPKRFPADKSPVWTLPALLFYKRTPTLEDRFTYEEFSGLMPIKLLRKDVEDQSDFALFSVFSGLKWYLYTTPEQGPCTLDPARFKQSEINWHPHLPRVVEMCQMMQWQAGIQFSPEFEGFPDGVAEDEIARGIRYMTKHREIPIWVQFAAQTYIDIQDVLDSLLDAPLKELHKWVATSSFRLDEFLSDNARLRTWDLTLHEQFTKLTGSLLKSQRSLELWLKHDVFKKSLAKFSPPHLSKFKREENALLR